MRWNIKVLPTPSSLAASRAEYRRRLPSLRDAFHVAMACAPFSGNSHAWIEQRQQRPTEARCGDAAGAAAINPGTRGVSVLITFYAMFPIAGVAIQI